jgi:hypothetical protein
MTQERVEMLNLIGFQWEAQVTWTNRFEELKGFQKEHGHCRVPQCFPENEALGLWVTEQRAQHRRLLAGEMSSMTQERVKMLTSIGFQWEAPRRKSSSQDSKDQFTIQVGTRLDVFWPLDDQHYPATVTEQSTNGKVFLTYDDGEKEWLNLTEHDFKLLGAHLKDDGA